MLIPVLLFLPVQLYHLQGTQLLLHGTLLEKLLSLTVALVVMALLKTKSLSMTLLLIPLLPSQIPASLISNSLLLALLPPLVGIILKMSATSSAVVIPLSSIPFSSMTLAVVQAMHQAHLALPVVWLLLLQVQVAWL